jgi:NADPH:quinone reductase-like Zn-dependent oxidoreductase
VRAAWIETYGGAETVRFGDFETPSPGPREVLVAVHAASVNPIDWKLRQGLLREVFPLTLPIVLGRDFSGVVAATGSEVEGIHVGEEVFGLADMRRGGSHAEFLAADHRMVARKPRNLSHIEAASLPLVGLTALTALEEAARLHTGQRVLIHAGAGGVGGFAVQYAHHVGALIAATCGAENVDYVAGLGADCVIDYATEDFAVLLSGLDLVFDTLGGDVHRRSFAVLRPGGMLVHINAAPLAGEAPRGDVVVKSATVTGRRALLERIADLAEHTIITPQVTNVLPLAEAGSGYELSRGGHVRGKIVLDLAA